MIVSRFFLGRPTQSLGSTRVASIELELITLACIAVISCGVDAGSPSSNSMLDDDDSDGIAKGGKVNVSVVTATNPKGGAASGGTSATGGRIATGGVTHVGSSDTGSGGQVSGYVGGSSATSECRSDAELSGASDLEYADNCVRCAGEDRCLQCVCAQCTAQTRACAETLGCLDISACVKKSGCTGIDCYCGQIDALRCATGEADGPCRDVMLSAPSGRIPTIANPSAGPASDAAVAVSTCINGSSQCTGLCK